MEPIKGVFSRTKSLINFLLIIIQGIILAAFSGMVDSRSDFEEISTNIFPSSTYLMDSHLTDILLSPVVAIGILLVFIVSLAKEFVLKNINKKILINISMLLVFSIILGLVSYGLYAPIGNQ